VADEKRDDSNHKNLEEVTKLISDVFQKLADRGTTAARDKFNKALSEFQGTLQNIDDELENGEKEKE
jgi:ElaB/YqjD/DUF883 family membrane-anchored ribosome-binding protein